MVKLRTHGFTTKEEDDGKEPYMQGLGCSNDFCPAEAVIAVVLRY